MINAEDHLAIAYAAASKFRKYSEFDYEDVLQEGFLALCEACKGFDSGKGYCFYNYAYTTIIRAINAYKLRKATSFRVSIKDSCFRKTISKLHHLSPDCTLKDIISLCDKYNLDAKIVEQIAAIRVVSSESFLMEDQKEFDSWVYEDVASIEEMCSKEDLLTKLIELIEFLPVDKKELVHVFLGVSKWASPLEYQKEKNMKKEKFYYLLGRVFKQLRNELLCSESE